MKNKNLYLTVGVLASLVFVGYLSESEPHRIFGLSINIWIIRIVWLLFAIVNISSYLRLKKLEK